MQKEIDEFRRSFNVLTKSFDDSLNQSKQMENFNVQLSTSENSIRKQLETNLKQRFDRTFFFVVAKKKTFLVFLSLTSVEIRREKLVEQTSILFSRLNEIRRLASLWKSNVTNLSVDFVVPNGIREKLKEISDEASRFEKEIESFSKNIAELNVDSRYFAQELKHVELSVDDASRVKKNGESFSEHRFDSNVFRKLRNSSAKSKTEKSKRNAPSKQRR